MGKKNFLNDELRVGEMLEKVWGKFLKVFSKYFKESKNASWSHVDKDFEWKGELDWVLEQIMSEELDRLLVRDATDGYQLG
jgi:hypothetical protein